MSPGHGDAIPCDAPALRRPGRPARQRRGLAPGARGRRDPRARHAPRVQHHVLHLRQPEPRTAKIVQVDQEPTRGRPLLPDRARHRRRRRRGSARSSLAALGGHAPGARGRSAGRRRFRDDRAQAPRRARRGGRRRARDPIQPGHALPRAARERCPTDAMFTMDAGTLCLQATDQMPYRQPPALFTPLDFGLVGFSYAAGLGIKLACPRAHRGEPHGRRRLRHDHERDRHRGRRTASTPSAS